LTRRIVVLIAQVIASAFFACLVFFAVLTLWGLVFAPFVYLESASFLIICALAVSAVLTVLVHGRVYRWLKNRHS